MLEGIGKLSKETRLFISSIGFNENLSQDLISDLDKLVQRKNICFVCSAGNISEEEIDRCLISGAKYPTYLHRYPVTPPASGSTVISVGSLSKKTIAREGNSWSITDANSVSPHSRCGCPSGFLYDCKKPEVVEHGGNINVINGKIDHQNVGVTSINKNGTFTNSLVGTSFSSPLYIRKLAGIESRWGRNIKNAETLKAISIVACRPIGSNCSGHGEPLAITEYGMNHALYIAEGSIGLSDYTEKHFINIFYHEIPKIKVPAGIEKIDLCIAHSDDFQQIGVM
jgi:hypothetical protein